MRTISGTLLAAQKAASAEPYVRCYAQNRIAGVVRLDTTVADATANTIAQHGAAALSTQTLIRARIDAGAVKHSRSLTAGSSISTTWTTYATGKGTRLNCCALSARVAIVYTDAANTGIKLAESTDSGATYAAEAAVVTAPAAVGQLACAYKSDGSGDLAVAWVEAAALKIIKRVAGVWGAVATCPTAVNSYTGLALIHDTDYRIMITGTEQTTTRPTLWTLTYGDGFDFGVGAWSSFQIQQQAESDASVTYWSPFLCYSDTYRATFVEVDAFSGGATRVYRTTLLFPLLWSSGSYTWTTPVPVDYGQTYGLACCASSSYYFESAPDTVLRAARALITLDLSARVLAAHAEESDRELRGWVDIDNTDAAYAGQPSPLQLGNQVNLGWGYKTSAGNEYSTMADMEIAGLEYRRTGGVSAIRLQLAGGWARLRRNRQRTSIYHAVSTLSYTQILARIFARGGVTLGTTAPSTRAGAIKPAFQIAPSTNAYDAVRQVLEFVADRIRMTAANAATQTEPLSSEGSDYTFGGEHAVYSSAVSYHPPPASEAYAFGAATFGEAIDYANAQQALGTRAHRRDYTSTTPATAAATAAAHLRQLQLDQDAGELVVPPCCGLEVLDVIDITDPYVSAATVTRRVRALEWRYDVIAGRYEQRIALGAV